MQIPPNSTIILLDSEVGGKFYIKTTDDIGLGKLRVFSYVEEPDNDSVNTSSTPNVDLSNYVTRAELEEVVKEIKNNEPVISTIKSDSK